MKRQILMMLIISIQVAISAANYSITNVSLDPSSRKVLAYGEDLNIEFDYSKPTGGVKIFARPLKNGNLVPNYSAHASQVYTSNTGHTSGFFSFDASAEIDQIEIQIQDANSRVVLYEKLVDANYTWKEYDISNITPDKTSPAILGFGEKVNVTFDYMKPDGDVRIFARAMKDGSKVPNSLTSGSPLYTNNTGNSSGFFYFNSNVEVDQIRFQIIKDGTSTVLYEEFVDVNYTWKEYDISNITPDKTSPAILGFGEKVNVTFDYMKSDGDVRIFARGMKDGSKVPNSLTSGSPLYTNNTGNSSGFFYFNSNVEVDQIRFQIIKDGTSTVLYEEFVDVDYTWKEYDISNMTLETASPAILGYGARVNIEFDYLKSTGDVRIFTEPMKNGSPAPNSGTNGSPLYTTNTGNATGFFQFNTDAEVDQIRIRIKDETTKDVLYEEFFDVDFTWKEYDISNITIDTASPAIIGYGQKVNIEFDYLKPTGDVRIHTLPMTNGNPTSGYRVNGSPLHTTNTGSTTGYFFFNSDAEVDQIRIQIKDEVTKDVLYQEFVDVDFTCKEYDISNMTLETASPAILGYGERVNIEFDYLKSTGDVRIFTEPMKNGSPAPNSGTNGSPLYTTNTGNATGFFLFNTDAEVDQIRIRIKDETTKDVLYEEFFDVDYTYTGTTPVFNHHTDEEILLYPNPVHSQLNIKTPYSSSFDYAIYNTGGSMVMAGRSSNSTVHLDFSHLSTGLYMVHIKHPEKTIIKKIIKK